MDVVELLTAVSLKDVRTVQEVAELKVNSGPGQGLATLVESETTGELSIDINPVAWGSRIEIWFRARFETPTATLVSAVATVYERETDDDVPEATRIDFVEKVAVMAAYSYLRSSLQQLAATMRLGPFTLDILRQGEFEMTTAADVDASSR